MQRRTGNQGRNFLCTDATVIAGRQDKNKGRRMTPGHVESEAACAMCALTPSAPVRGTEMGVQVQVQVGVCVPRHELIMQPRRPLITLGSVFQVLYPEQRLRCRSIVLQWILCCSCTIEWGHQAMTLT